MADEPLDRDDAAADVSSRPGSEGGIEIPDFDLEAEIGRGGMGVVYRARQRSLRRTVALKTITPGRLEGQSAVERFRREAEAAGRLSHPNIVPVYEFGSSRGTHYFTMGFVEGQSLATRLQAGPLPEREAVQILRDVARAIQYAHEQGVVHRDLKPANVLLDRSGVPRVTDFGLAKNIDQEDGLTMSGDMLGTPSYMPPEQVIGNTGNIGPGSDVWGLGAMLYALLSGRPPFVGRTVIDTVRQVLEHEPIPLRVIAPDVSRDLDLIVSKCLQKPIELRYRSAGALADDLDAFLVGGTISAASARFSDLVARWLGDTPQGHVLDFWGPLWLAQGIFLFVMMLTAQILLWAEVSSRLPYALALVLSFVAWSPIFIYLRRRRGPITHSERQLAHIWGGNLLSMAGVLVAETILGLPVLTLAPLMLLMGAATTFAMAAMLSGVYYLHTAAHLVGVGLMIVVPEFKMLIVGLIASAAFVIPGLQILLRSRARPDRSGSHESFHWSVEADDSKTHGEARDD